MHVSLKGQGEKVTSLHSRKTIVAFTTLASRQYMANYLLNTIRCQSSSFFPLSPNLPASIEHRLRGKMVPSYSGLTDILYIALLLSEEAIQKAFYL